MQDAVMHSVQVELVPYLYQVGCISYPTFVFGVFMPFISLPFCLCLIPFHMQTMLFSPRSQCETLPSFACFNICLHVLLTCDIQNQYNMSKRNPIFKKIGKYQPMALLTTSPYFFIKGTSYNFMLVFFIFYLMMVPRLLISKSN